MTSALFEKVLLEKSLPLSDQPSTSASELEPVDDSADRKLLWKVDRHLVSILSLLL